MTLTIGNREFRPTPLPSLLAAVLVALTAGLGAWQLQRAAEKQQLFDQFDAAQQDREGAHVADGRTAEYPPFTPLQADGRFDSAHQVLLDAMLHEGRAGYQVLTPLLRSDGPAILVNRGWLPADPQRGTLPELAVDTGYRQLRGYLGSLPRPALRLEAPTPSAGADWPRVLLYPRREQLEQMLGYAVLDLVLLQAEDQPDGFLRQWRPQVLPPERHLGYAAQWFGLCLALIVIYLAVNFRRSEDA